MVPMINIFQNYKLKYIDDVNNRAAETPKTI